MIGVLRAVATGGVGGLFVLVVACSSQSNGNGDDDDADDKDDERASGTTTSPLSFSAGNNDGYCASNPSAGCRHGTPLGAKKLALTFDDGPGTQTLALSAWLKGQNIRATFFVVGKRLGEVANPSGLLSQVAADGHLIGNHTQNHVDLTTFAYSTHQLLAPEPCDHVGLSDELQPPSPPPPPKRRIRRRFRVRIEKNTFFASSRVHMVKAGGTTVPLMADFPLALIRMRPPPPPPPPADV